MKILVVYPYLPYPLNRGTFHRTFHLLRELAQRHEVDLVALAENGEGREHQAVFERFCRRVEIVDFVHPPWQKLFPARLLNPLPPNVAHWTVPALAAAIDRALASRRYDAVHVCDIVMAQYFMRHHRTVPLVMDRSRVDLQYQLMEHHRLKFSVREKLLRYEGYTKLWLYERAVARRAALEVVCGPDDETFIRRYISRSANVAVVVNGVDIQFFDRDREPGKREDKPTIMFCGAMDYNPNVDALRWYFAEMHGELVRRVPNLQVWLVGKDPTSEVRGFGSQPGVTVTGGVPDVRPYYRRAWLQIVPLRIGGGTRLKIVESLSIGTPVVSTTIGAQGLSLEDGSEILLADSARDFVNATVRCLEDETLRARMEQAGINTARRRFSWEMMGRQLNEIYDQIIMSDGKYPGDDVMKSKVPVSGSNIR